MPEPAAPQPIKNILVMTDFSPPAEAALRYAAGWARRLGAAVHVVHFMRPAIYGLAGEAYGQLMEQLWKDSQEAMDAIAVSATLAGLVHTQWLHPGDIWDGLPGLVKDKAIDLIVLASTGRTGLRKIMLGSTAETVFRAMACPVMILGPGAGAYAQFEAPRSVLLATDFGAATPRAVRHALALATSAQAPLRLLTVLPGDAGDASVAIGATEQAAIRLRGLLSPDEAEAVKARFLVRAGDPAAEILAGAKETAADVIVLGARRPPQVAFYTGWAVAYRVVGHAACPVLTVRE